jgi:hypothetical protein
VITNCRRTTPCPVRPSTSIPDLRYVRSHPQNLSAGFRQTSKRPSQLQNTYASTGFTLRDLSPVHAPHLPARPSSETEPPAIDKPDTRRGVSPDDSQTILNQTRQRHTFSGRDWLADRSKASSRTHNSPLTNMRDARCSQLISSTKHNTPSLWQSGSFRLRSESRLSSPMTPAKAGAPFAQSPGNHCVVADRGKDMTLVDIDNFELRSKVAQLMAVAPALPIRDLYHLIIDSEGRLSKAKKRAIRMSEAPDTRRMPKQLLTLQSQTLIINPGTEDIMVKIDPNDPTFKWDEDEPAPEPTPMTKARRRKSVSKSKDTSSCHSANVSKRKKPATQKRSSRAKKRAKTSLSKRASARETSSDREFVVADNVIECVLDSDDPEDFDVSCDDSTPT